MIKAIINIDYKNLDEATTRNQLQELPNWVLVDLLIRHIKEKINVIKYIRNEDIDVCTIKNNDIVDVKKELLEILGDKENENIE